MFRAAPHLEFRDSSIFGIWRFVSGASLNIFRTVGTLTVSSRKHCVTRFWVEDSRKEAISMHQTRVFDTETLKTAPRLRLLIKTLSGFASSNKKA